MDYNIELKDIADDLVILNKNTVDTLYKLDNCADCIALYVFYYKTAKWQKTNQIKANDVYVGKCLNWGSKKIRETKKTLKEKGLIDIIQKRENGKISGWYIRIYYVVSIKNNEDIKIIVDSNNASNQQVVASTSSFEETNALKEYIKCLKKEIEILKGQKENIIKEKYFDNEEINNIFLEFLEVRKKLKAVNSERAIKTLINKLNKYSDDIKFKMIERSVVNSWKDVYELKEQKSEEIKLTQVSKGAFQL